MIYASFDNFFFFFSFFFFEKMFKTWKVPYIAVSFKVKLPEGLIKIKHEKKILCLKIIVP